MRESMARLIILLFITDCLSSIRNYYEHTKLYWLTPHTERAIDEENIIYTEATISRMKMS